MTRLLFLFAACGFSALNSGGTDLAGHGPGPLVFVTSKSVHGDMNATLGATPGQFGGDLQCNGLLPGRSFRAWLSTTDQDAIDRVVGSGPWYRSDGSVGFPDRASLTSGPSSPINLDENGAAVPAHSPVWTGTAADGRVHPSGQLDCNRWVTQGGGIEGQAGDSDQTGAGWTDSTTELCSVGARLYCFESG